MDNFDLNEYMDLAEAYVGPMIDSIYRRLIVDKTNREGQKILEFLFFKNSNDDVTFLRNVETAIIGKSKKKQQ